MMTQTVAMHTLVVSLRPSSSVIRGSHLRPLQSYEQHLDMLYQNLLSQLAGHGAGTEWREITSPPARSLGRGCFVV